MKNSNDIIGNRARDLPTGSAVPQPTATPRNPSLLQKVFRSSRFVNKPKILLHFFPLTIKSDVKF